jgi:DNA-binding transcriptional LysR family regulator
MSDGIDLALLRSFATAARSGSLNRAAQALGLTQPAVSQQLRRLERATGRVLLDRSTRGVVLTADGQTILRYADRILALTSELSEAVAPDARGAFRVGLLEDVVAVGLADVLADFAAVHRDARLDVVVAPSPALGRELAAGALDLVLGDPVGIGPAAGRPQRRATFPLVWAAHPRLDLAADPLPVVLFHAPCAWRDAVVDALDTAGRRWRAAVEASSLPAIQAAVAAGLGVTALLPGTVPRGTRVPKAAVGDAGALPTPGSVELALYRRRDHANPAALARLDALLWRTLA